MQIGRAIKFNIMGKKEFVFKISDLNTKPIARKKTKEAVIKTETGFIDALAALPEELQDDKFLNAYIRTRSQARSIRGLRKQEKDQAQATLDQAKKLEKEVESDGELIYTIRNPQFIMNCWQLPSGKIFKEVIARPGLTVN